MDRVVIKICIPFYNEIHPKTIETVETIAKAFPGSKIQKLGGTYIAQARNFLVNGGKSQKAFQVIPGEFTHYLFVDSDVYANDPVKAVSAMLSIKESIVGGLYPSRVKKAYYTAGWFNKDAAKGVLGLWVNSSSNGVQHVDWVGAGFLLVKREVFEKLKYPWFSCCMIENGDDRDQAGEDVGFCINAAEAGYRICAVPADLVHDPWWQKNQVSHDYVDILNRMECEFNRSLDNAKQKFSAMRTAFEDVIENMGTK